MRIISIHYGLSLGGVAKYAATLEGVSKFTPAKIKSVCILAPGRIVDQDALEQLDAYIIEINSAFDTSWISKLKVIIGEFRPECILSHGFNGHFVSLIAGHGVCRIATYHGSYHATSFSRRLVEPLYNGFTHWFMRNKAKSVLNVAQHCVDFLTEHGVSPGKLEVVHNGIVDLTPVTDKRDAIRSEWGFTNKHTLIGAASRLDPVKGLEYLIKAFALISDKFPDAQLVILGDGTLREALENQAEQLKISDRVLFTGMRNDIPDCLNALDIFALPSLAEYHSIGLLEAMRAGLPIIATDVGGNTESVRDEQEGLIVESSNANQFSDALIRLLGDEELSSKFANAARKRFLEEFTEDAMLKKTAAWLEKVCSN